MSKIDELIEKLCPDGVAVKKLGEVGVFIRGNGLQKKDFQEKGVGCIHYGQIYTYYKTAVYKTKSFVSIEFSKKLKRANTNDLIIAGVSENIEDVCKTVVWLGDGEICVSGDTFIFKHKENGKYLAYLLQLENFNQYKRQYAIGAKVTRLRIEKLKNYLVPIPPIEIQNTIVKLLDQYASLEAELEARKTQYEHYRDVLLSFESKNVEWKTLGDIGNFTRGKRFVKLDIQNEGTPCIHYGEMYTHYKIWARQSKSFLNPELASRLRSAKPNDIIIVAAGETIEDIGQGIAWLGDTDVVIHDACFAYSHSMHPNFVAHFLQTDIFHSQIKKHISSGKISSINASGLSKAKIPVPPIEIQKQIADVLDKFHMLVNDISTGIPAEIKARRKQYEYYRNKLLTFKHRSNG
jgi:type I restriction enzyme S subunit